MAVLSQLTHVDCEAAFQVYELSACVPRHMLSAYMNSQHLVAGRSVMYRQYRALWEAILLKLPGTDD